MEGLVPDLVDLGGIAPACADPVRAAVEEEEAGDAVGMAKRQPLHDIGPDIVADEAGPGDAEAIEQGRDIVGQNVRPRLVRRTRDRVAAFAEAAEVGSDQAPSVGQSVEHGFPGRPEFRPTVQQQKRRAAAGFRHVSGETACFDEAVLYCRHNEDTPGRGRKR